MTGAEIIEQCERLIRKLACDRGGEAFAEAAGYSLPQKAMVVSVIRVETHRAGMT
jgi:hypothetical protein